MSEAEIKACPFCEGTGRVEKKWQGRSPIINDNEDYAYFVVCNSCACEGPWRKTESGAIREWNTRPIEDALRAERDELRTRYAGAVNVGANMMTEITNLQVDKSQLKRVLETALEFLKTTEAKYGAGWVIEEIEATLEAKK